MSRKLKKIDKKYLEVHQEELAKLYKKYNSLGNTYIFSDSEKLTSIEIENFIKFYRSRKIDREETENNHVVS